MGKMQVLENVNGAFTAILKGSYRNHNGNGNITREL